MPVIHSGNQGLAVLDIACVYTLKDTSWLEGLADKKKPKDVKNGQ